MAIVGVAIKAGIESAVILAKEMITWCEENKHQVVCDSVSYRVINNKKENFNNLKEITIGELARSSDPIVTLGGDGTLLGIGRYVEGRSPVMIGVNFGALGFLTEIAPSELLSTLINVLAGRGEYGERAMLRAEVVRDGTKIFCSQAVNDVVVQKGVRHRLLDLDLTVDNQDVMRLRADGIIVATPTGSTAYSLSAGGSIVHPSVAVALITPICPHSLTNRPLILGLESTIRITIPPYDGEVFLIIDGQVSTPLKEGDALHISKAATTVRFARSPRRNYFEILRTKLNWGIANKPE